MRLDLVISGNNLGIRRRHTLMLRAATPGTRGTHDTLLLLLLLRLLVPLCPVVRTGLGPWLSRDDVDDVVPGVLAILREALVLVVVRVGELGDDVPRVQKSGDEAEAGEEDIDEGVCAADAALHPD